MDEKKMDEKKMDEKEMGEHCWNIVVILSHGLTVTWQYWGTKDELVEGVRERVVAYGFSSRSSVAKVFAGSDTHHLLEFPVEDAE
jgi:hypothetical protein